MATDAAGNRSETDGPYRPGTPTFGPNAWLVEDMYDRYLADPTSVSDSWREFFADYRAPDGAGSGRRVAPRCAALDGARDPAAAAGHRTIGEPAGLDACTSQRPAPVTPAEPATPQAQPATPAATQPEARSAAEPAAELPTRSPLCAVRPAASWPTWRRRSAVPTATSVRVVPAKLLEVNRTIVNNQLVRTTGGKVSFTHLIGYAVVKALGAVPAMNASFVADADGKGTPGVVRHRHVGLGPGRRRREGRREPDPARAVHHRCRHAGLPQVRGRLRGAGAQDPHQQDRRRTTSPAPR